MTLWEGGVRGIGFVHGKLLARRGVTCKEMLHVTDWYPTLLGLAGKYTLALGPYGGNIGQVAFSYTCSVRGRR